MSNVLRERRTLGGVAWSVRLLKEARRKKKKKTAQRHSVASLFSHLAMKRTANTTTIVHHCNLLVVGCLLFRGVTSRGDAGWE